MFAEADVVSARAQQNPSSEINNVSSLAAIAFGPRAPPTPTRAVREIKQTLRVPTGRAFALALMGAAEPGRFTLLQLAFCRGPLPLPLASCVLQAQPGGDRC
jgi:hypothetical protein